MATRKHRSSVNTRKSIPKLAKLAPPRLSGVYPRTRLFRLLDSARRKSIVWITAPAGAGKTTLLASYLQKRNLPALWYQVDASDNDIGAFFYHMGLAAEIGKRQAFSPLPLFTSEYLSGLSAFTVNFFRALFERLPHRGIVVLDNFHELASGTIQEVLRQGFEQVPAGLNVVVLSREEPSGPLARLRASGLITLLGWNALKLTEQETTAIAKLRGKRHIAPRELYQQTQGWVAGVVLLTEQSSTGASDVRMEDVASPVIFDYFANEILRDQSPATQEVLLQTAFLPKISPDVVQKLSSDERPGNVLQQLTRRNFFTVRHADGSYDYHPLFREFLLNRANAAYTPEQIREIKKRCAELLADDGDVESAIRLLQAAQEWEAAMQLILRHAASLRAQGRAQTLEEWLKTLPNALRTSNPWALYWLGLCRLHYSPGQAREYFEQAFTLFEQQDDASPLYLVFSRIIESYLFETDDYGPMGKWLARYPTLKIGRKPPRGRIESASVFSYLIGLMNFDFTHPDVTKYAEHAEQIYSVETEPRLKLAQAVVLIPYHMWRGDVFSMEKLIDHLPPEKKQDDEAFPIGRISWYTYRSLNCGITSMDSDSARAVMDGLALADSTGVHVLDIQLVANGIWGLLGAGKVAAARTLLPRMAPLVERGQIQQAIYRHLISMTAIHEGDLVKAIDEGKKAMEHTQKLHWFYGMVAYPIALAFAYAQRGDTEAALAVLGHAWPLARSMQSKSFVSYCALCEANIRRLQGDREATLRLLRQALTLAREGGFITPAYCPRDAAAFLYAMALDEDIQPEHVRTTIEKTDLPPPPGLLSDKWPWKIRLYTFGKFAIVKNETPLMFRGREYQKPLAVLRAIASHGGRYVNISKLIQQLWPENDGTAAIHAFDTTLYRLRKLLGDECFITQDGQISLNPEHCWFDVWTVEQLLDVRIGAMPPALRTEKLLDLYRGPFLDGDDMPWTIVERERLRTKFLAAISQIAQTLESAGEHESAVACYRRGLDTDPYAEALYRQLMRCYRQLNRPAEAMTVYQRCFRTFTSALHVEPSAETTALYEEIKQGLG